MCAGFSSSGGFLALKNTLDTATTAGAHSSDSCLTAVSLPAVIPLCACTHWMHVLIVFVLGVDAVQYRGWLRVPPTSTHLRTLQIYDDVGPPSPIRVRHSLYVLLLLTSSLIFLLSCTRIRARLVPFVLVSTIESKSRCSCTHVSTGLPKIWAFASRPRTHYCCSLCRRGPTHALLYATHLLARNPSRLSPPQHRGRRQKEAHSCVDAGFFAAVGRERSRRNE